MSQRSYELDLQSPSGLRWLWRVIKSYSRAPWYLLKHKWYAFLVGEQTEVPFYRRVLQGFDWPRLYSTDFSPYAQEIFEAMPYELRNEYLRILMKCQRRRKYYWQYWVVFTEDGGIEPLPMTIPQMQQMICNWMAAHKALTGSWDIIDWYRKYRLHLILYDPDYVDSEVKRLVKIMTSLERRRRRK